MSPRIFPSMPGDRRHNKDKKKLMKCPNCGKLVAYYKKKKLFSKEYLTICSECGGKIK